MNKNKLTLEDIKKALDPVKRAQFVALIDFFENKGETAMATKLKFWGKPKCVYHHPELQQFAQGSFTFLGCEIRKLHTLPEGMIVFSWGDEHELLPPPRPFIPESYSSLDGIRKPCHPERSRRACANPSQLNNGERK